LSLTTKSSSILSAAPFNLQLVLDQVETMSNPPKTTITNRTPISLPLALALLQNCSKFRRASVREAGSSTGKRKYRGRATLRTMSQLASKVAKITRTIETKSGVTLVPDNLGFRHNNLVTVNSTSPVARTAACAEHTARKEMGVKLERRQRCGVRAQALTTLDARHR